MFMYRQQLVAVDSDVDGRSVSSSPDLRDLQLLGLDSWELIDVIPRTSGITMQNDVVQEVGIFVGKVGEAHAGGIGGLVNGAYLLLRKEILPIDLTPLPADELLQYLESLYLM
jgi:hypothetical protein